MPAEPFCNLSAMRTHRCRLSCVEQRRRPIRPGLFASSSAFPPAERPTLSRASWLNGCRTVLDSHSSSRTGRAPAPMSRPSRSSRQPADGYTLLFATGIQCDQYSRSTTNSISTLSMTSSPIAGIDRLDLRPGRQSVGSVQDDPRTDRLRQGQPGKLNIAAAAIGSGTHLSGELFRAMTGVNIVSVPYTGSRAGVRRSHGGAGPLHVRRADQFGRTH